MIRYGLPVLFALLLWWGSTGAILMLDRMPGRRTSFAVATALLGLAVAGLVATGASASMAGAYIAFGCGLAIWGWLELGYYTGLMDGPRRAGPPENGTAWRRFAAAVGTTLYHELAALALIAMIAAVVWDMPNKVALWTFLILWSMQISAKINVFLGVPNLAEEFLPDHLGYLRGYMTRKPMNLFFPVSITGSMILTMALASGAVSASSQAGAAGATMLATLAGLALLEHWFLVLPLPVEALWRWMLRNKPATETKASEIRLRRRPLGRVLAAGLPRSNPTLIARRPV